MKSMNVEKAAGPPLNGSSAPLYQQVAQLIERRVHNDTYPVGSLLPTENELARELSVSRQTVRLAIAQLRQRGQLSARKGVGTWVEAGRGDWRNRFQAQSRAELFDFARETELHIAVRCTTTARGRQAAEIGCRAGKKWNYFAGPRFFAGEPRPFCYNEVFLEPRLAPVLTDVTVLRSALFTLVEESSGERIAEIVQEMRAITFEAHKAEAIGIAPGALGLQISRRYYGSGHRLLEYAIQSHPADSFVYRVTLKSSD